MSSPEAVHLESRTRPSQSEAKRWFHLGANAGDQDSKALGEMMSVSTAGKLINVKKFFVVLI